MKPSAQAGSIVPEGESCRVADMEARPIMAACFGKFSGARRGFSGDEVTRRLHQIMRGYFGDGTYESWFCTLEVENWDGETVTASVPVKFVKTWVDQYYLDQLKSCCELQFKGVKAVKLVLRDPGITPKQRDVIAQELRIASNWQEWTEY